MQILLSASLVVAAITHLLPLAGVTGSSALTALYGLPFDENNFQILMRHRAVLFGILGGLLLYAVFSTRIQAIATLAGLLSAGVCFLIAAVLPLSMKEA